MLVQSLLLPLLTGALCGAPTVTMPLPASGGVVGQDEAAPAVVSPGTSLLLRANRVIVRPGKEILGAEVLVQNGRIVSVGKGLVAPEGARVLEGEVICAGFVDPWSSLGMEAGSVSDFGTSPSTQAVDAIDPFDPSTRREEALRAGVTCVRVQTGLQATLSGVGSVVRSAPGPSDAASDVIVLGDACMAATLGITRGGRSLDVFDRVNEVDQLVGQIERGRSYRESWVEYRHDIDVWEKAIAESAAKLEKDFKKAKKDRDKAKKDAEEKGKEFKEEKYKEDKKPNPPKYDPDAEALARVAEGEIPFVVEVHRAPELRALLAKTEKYDRLRLVIAGGTEAVVHAKELAARRIPVIVWPSPNLTGRPDEYDAHDLALAGKLSAAGVQVLIGSGGGPNARELRSLAALAVGHGLDHDAALAAITSNAAGVLDVRDSLGTVERGKLAELLVLDGDPLDTTSRIQFVISNGKVVVE